MFDSFDVPDRAAENPSTALQACLVSFEQTPPLQAVMRWNDPRCRSKILFRKWKSSL